MTEYIKSAPCVQNIFRPQIPNYYKIIRPYSSLFLAFFRVLDRIHYLIKNLVGKKSIVNPFLFSSKNRQNSIFLHFAPKLFNPSILHRKYTLSAH